MAKNLDQSLPSITSTERSDSLHSTLLFCKFFHPGSKNAHLDPCFRGRSRQLRRRRRPARRDRRRSPLGERNQHWLLPLISDRL